MIPDPGEILRRRVTVLTVIRLLSIVPMTVSLLIVGGLISSIVNGRARAEDYVAFGIMIFMFAAAASILWAVAPFFARKIVTMPRKIDCPACRYRLEGLTEARCPECGLVLTSEFLAAPGEKTPPPREPDRVLLRLIATLVLRLIAIIGLLASIPITLIGTIETLRWGSGDPEEWAILAVAYLMLLIGAGLLLLAGWLSGLIVPPRSAFGSASDRPPPQGPNA